MKIENLDISILRNYIEFVDENIHHINYASFFLDLKFLLARLNQHQKIKIDFYKEIKYINEVERKIELIKFNSESSNEDFLKLIPNTLLLRNNTFRDEVIEKLNFLMSFDYVINDYFEFSKLRLVDSNLENITLDLENKIFSADIFKPSIFINGKDFFFNSVKITFRDWCDFSMFNLSKVGPYYDIVKACITMDYFSFDINKKVIETGGYVPNQADWHQYFIVSPIVNAVLKSSINY